MTLVVSDNSPLNVLIRIECEDILPKLFERVFVPPEVADEMAHPAAPDSVREFILHPPTWLFIQSPKQLLSLPGLDPGEAAAISLANEVKAPLLIDERNGRKAAKEIGVEVIGAVGALERAADLRLIPDLAAVYKRIRGLDYHVSEMLLTQSLDRHLTRKQQQTTKELGDLLE